MIRAVTPTNRVVILGGDLQFEESAVRLGPISIARAERFLAYHHDHSELFQADGEGARPDPFVLCVGGSGLLAAGVELPADGGSRESTLVKDYLVERGISEQVTKTENESTSTLTNLTNSIDEGLLVPKEYGSKDPLGIVSHPAHLKRAIYFAGRLGFSRESIIPIPTREQDDPRREWVLRTGYKMLLWGAHDAREMVPREQRLYLALAAARGLPARLSWASKSAGVS